MLSSEIVSEFYGEILKRPSSYKKAIASKGYILEQVMLITRGAQDAGALLSNAFRKLGYQFQLSDFVARNVLENIIVDNFARNNPTDEKIRNKKGFSLEMALSDLPMDEIFSFNDESPMDILSPQSGSADWYPPSDVFNQVMESINQLTEKGLLISLNGED